MKPVVITDEQGKQTGVYRALHDPELFEIRVKLSNLPPETRETHRLFNWEQVPSLADAFNKAKEFAFGKPPHHFLTFGGEPGTGKTHLAIAILWEFLEQERGSGQYWQVGSLLDYLRASYSKEVKGEESDIDTKINYTKKCTLLIIDDLGACKLTEWAEEKLDEIVDHRYINHKLTVFTTNVKSEQLPKRVSDRMSEGQVHILEAESYRKKKSQLREKE